MTSKAEIREEARRRVAAISPELRNVLGRKIAEKVWMLPRVNDARVILLYASLPNEVPTDEIAAEARGRGIEVVYPRCLRESGEMSLHRVAGEHDLVSGGAFGIREPAESCRLTDVEEIDLAFIPGLGWDRSGNRIGRGAGYYDRLLSRPAWRALRFGLFFAAQEFEQIPTDPWDRPLNSVITDDEVVVVSS